MAAERTSRRRRDSRGGFVLAELLATLAVSAGVLVALASLTGLVSLQARRAKERVDQAELVGRTLASLTRDIGLAARTRWAGPPERRAFVFRGTPDRILFALNAPASQPGGASPAPTLAVQVQSDVAAGLGEVLRTQAPLPPTSPALDALAFEPVRTLYRGAMQVRFAYVMAATADAPEVLLDEWAFPDRMPVAVRVSVSGAEPGRPEASLRVPLLLTAEAGCAAPAKAFCSLSSEGAQSEEDGPSTASIINALQGRRP